MKVQAIVILDLADDVIQQYLNDGYSKEQIIKMTTDELQRTIRPEKFIYDVDYIKVEAI